MRQMSEIPELKKKRSAFKKPGSSSAIMKSADIAKLVQRNRELENEINELKRLLSVNLKDGPNASSAKKRRTVERPNEATKEFKSANMFASLDIEDMEDVQTLNTAESSEKILAGSEVQNVERAAKMILNAPKLESVITAMMKKNQVKQQLKPASKANENNNKTAPNTSEKIDSIASTIKRMKMPPINIYQQESKDIGNLLKNLLNSDQYIIKKVGRKHSVTVYNKIDYSAVKEALQKVSAPFYSYTPKDEKKSTYVLKGLDCSYTPEEILEELKNLNVKDLNFVSSFRLETNRSKKEKTQLPFIIVQISPESKPSALREIKYIFHHVVQWEKLKRQGLIQCHKCQRFTHTTANCNMDTRCVKCGENHDPTNCSLNETSGKEQLYCVLCGEHGHPASYGGCSAHEALKKKLKQKVTAAREVRREKEQMFQNYVGKGVSFADQLRGAKGVPSHSTQTRKLNPLDEIKNTVLDAMQLQFVQLAKTLEVQSKRIDTLFNIIGTLSSDE